WSILLTQQFLSLGRPRHQFAVKTNPISLQTVPDAGCFDCMADALQELRFKSCVAEESPSRSRVTSSGFSFHDSEPFPGRIRITTDHYDSSRPHMLLFTNDLVHAFVQVVSESVLGMFQQPIAFTCLAGRHSWWQIDEPLRIGA